MEVLDNGNPIKDTEDQTASSNYTCRLPRDLNIGNSSVARSKGETDVRLLVACKAQLSSEVIKWKTESLRLQKERDAARIRMKELDQILGKYTERTRELENRLSTAEDENKRLKGRLQGSSSISVLHKISSSLNKYHSYPWSSTRTNPSATSNSYMNTIEEKKNSVPQEEWKEVSQQLLEKMKQEMKELQELSCNLSLQENESSQVKPPEHETSVVDFSSDKLEDSLSGLISETVSIKHCLLEQRNNLKGLLNKALEGGIHICDKDKLKNRQRTINTFQSGTEYCAQSSKPKPSMIQSSRHSDDSFQEFFTKHLENCQNMDKMTNMQLFMQPDSQNTPHSNRSPVKASSPRSAKPQNQADKRIAEEERVCPICQARIDESIPQNEFEEHVLDHLETESASLLDQYVVL